MNRINVEMGSPSPEQLKKAEKISRSKEMIFLSPSSTRETSYPEALYPKLFLVDGREGPAYCETFARAEIVESDGSLSHIGREQIEGFRIYPYSMQKHPFTGDGEFLLLGLSFDGNQKTLSRLFKRSSTGWNKVQDFSTGWVLQTGDRFVFTLESGIFEVYDPYLARSVRAQPSNGFLAFGPPTLSLDRKWLGTVNQRAENADSVEVLLIKLETLEIFRLIEGAQNSELSSEMLSEEILGEERHSERQVSIVFSNRDVPFEVTVSGA